MLTKLQSRLNALPGWAKPIVFLAILFGSIGCCNAGFWVIRSTYLARVLPEREQKLKEFLAMPTNYKAELGGPLERNSIEGSYSDAFGTYTVFVCSGQILGKKVAFNAWVGSMPTYVRKIN
jgi:hypothetical protein